MLQIESELFQSVKARKLPHPTARRFDPEKWHAAVRALTTPIERDKQLFEAAIFFGHEIARLRERFEGSIFSNLDRRSALVLSIAMANYNYVIVDERARKKAREDARGGIVHFGLGARLTIPMSYRGNKASPDAAVGTIVDVLPHCLEHALALPNTGGTEVDFWKVGTNLFGVMSVERSLRDLWQQVLWNGWAIELKDKQFWYAPVDVDLATLWNVWLWRQEMITGQGMTLDALTDHAQREAGKRGEPFLSPAVVGIGGSSRENRRFRFGSVSGHAASQMSHKGQNTILEESYLASFIDAPLPTLSGLLSCRDLQKIWCVLYDCASTLIGRCKDRRLTDLGMVEAYALLIKMDELERAIVHCTGFDREQTSMAMKFLTCDLADLGTLFSKGFWASPLLDIDSDQNVALVLPAILVGSTIRRVESWLDRGGLSDHLSNARRGLNYEAWVRGETIDALSTNPLLSSASCASNSIRRSSEGDEQIDLLIMLGRKLIVGEIKCLLAPVESIERYNYIAKLKEAAAQATRKARWIIANPHVIAEAFKVSLEEVRSFGAVPIVVINQGAGLGLEVDGVRVVDFHFLQLYLSKNEYVKGAAFDRAQGTAILNHELLYSNAEEAESRFEGVMAHPPTLARFIKGAVWRDNRFPMSNGQDLLVANCHLDQSAADDAAAMAAVLRAKAGA